MSQEACVSDSNRGFELEGERLVNRYLAQPQKQPFRSRGSERQTGLGQPGTVDGQGQVWVAPGRLGFVQVISLGGPLGQFTSSVCSGEEELDHLP